MVLIRKSAALRWAVLAPAVASLAVSCRGGPARDGPPTVVAAFYPLAEAASRVGGDEVTVVDIAKPGIEPHELEPTTRDLDAIEDASVVVYIGGDFQPAVTRSVKRAEGVVVDVRDDDPDPHVWLDPDRMSKIAGRIADALSEADPSGSGGYATRAAAYRDELSKLGTDLEAGLQHCARRSIVTTHAAFGGFAARYKLEQRSLVRSDPEAEPDPERLAQLVDRAKREGVTTIFTEPGAPAEIVDTFARESGLVVATLDPVELDTGRTYVERMRDNLAAMRTALACT